MQNFSEAVQQAIQSAFQLAEQRRHPEVTENPLLLALLEDPEGYFIQILSELGTQPAELGELAAQALDRCSTTRWSIRLQKLC